MPGIPMTPRGGIMRKRTLSVLLFYATGAVASPAAAQIALHMDPSVASTGRNGTSVTVSWEDAPDYWANPALVAFYSGVYYDHSRTVMLPALANNMRYTTNRYAIGYNGLAVAFQGQPFAPGNGANFNWGLSSIVADDGTILGYYTPHETVESWTVGVRLSTLADAFLRRDGSREPAFERTVDLAIGVTAKVDSVNRWPAALVPDAHGRAEERRV